MRTLMLALTALIGFCSQADAQAQCPELTRLRNEAVASTLPARSGLVSNHCEAYIRTSVAWAATVQYAKDHRESCDISFDSLKQFEGYHREAVIARNNVCAGRPVKPFPAEIVQR
jgi:hypothetical protein